MTYQIFVRILSQLSQRNCAKVEVCEREILISKQGDRWSLSTMIFQGSEIPQEFKMLSRLHWQAQGAYIKMDVESQQVYLVQEVAHLKYLHLKASVIDFLEVASEWSGLLHEMAEKEDVC